MRAGVLYIILAAALIGVAVYEERIAFLQIVGCLLVLAAGIARFFVREGVREQVVSAGKR